jgi:hypothetical protein
MPNISTFRQVCVHLIASFMGRSWPRDFAIDPHGKIARSIRILAIVPFLLPLVLTKRLSLSASSIIFWIQTQLFAR